MFFIGITALWGHGSGIGRESVNNDYFITNCRVVMAAIHIYFEDADPYRYLFDIVKEEYLGELSFIRMQKIFTAIVPSP